MSDVEQPETPPASRGSHLYNQAAADLSKAGNVRSIMRSDNVTGRDGFIIEKALFYAAHFIDAQPDHLRARSDRADMLTILRARLGRKFAATCKIYGHELKEMTGRPFNPQAD